MGTRGYYGFRYKKKYYMIYNAFDSYFSQLGLKLLNEVRHMIKNHEYETWLNLFINLEIIFKIISKYKKIYTVLNQFF